MEDKERIQYPETYLRVVNNQSGQEWIQEIKPRWIIDLRTRIAHFLRTEFSGEVKISGDLSELDGEYTASIYTDGRRPEFFVCWDVKGFWTEPTY